jgi:uncharacterized protein YueI
MCGYVILDAAQQETKGVHAVTQKTGDPKPTRTSRLLAEIETYLTQRNIPYTRLDRAGTHEALIIPDATLDGTPVVLVINEQDATEETKRRMASAIKRFALVEVLHELFRIIGER